MRWIIDGYSGNIGAIEMTDYQQAVYELGKDEKLEEIQFTADGENLRLVAFHFGIAEIESVGFDIFNSEGGLMASFGVDKADAQKVAEFFLAQFKEKSK